MNRQHIRGGHHVDDGREIAQWLVGNAWVDRRIGGGT